MKKEFPVLYSRTSNDSIQQWQIVAEDNNYYTIEGLKGGKLTTSVPTVCEGKSVGRSNETNASDQALKEAQAKWDKKIKKHYL